MGRATDALAERAGSGVGGLLNATFGNAAELIIAAIGLAHGLGEVVKASITGSIIGNCLLVLGASLLAGGLKHPVQRFNRTAASLGSTLMALAAIGLLVPTIFWMAARETGTAESGAPAASAAVSPESHEGARAPESAQDPSRSGMSGFSSEDDGTGSSSREKRPPTIAQLQVLERGLSLEISAVLGLVYVLSLIFSLRTHSHLYEGEGSREHGEHGAGKGHEGKGGIGRAILQLLIASAFVGLLAEFLVGALEPTAHAMGLTDLFVGVIVVVIVGNAAEHSSAVFAAMRNDMDLAMHIAIGSSLQIALFVTPLLLAISYFVGPAPIDLHFTLFEVAGVALAVLAMALVALDGESHWMEGVMLLAVYVILGIAFYFLPG